MSTEQNTSCQDTFDAKLSEEILSDHLSMTRSQSRLLSVRTLIGLLATNYLTEFNHDVHAQHVEDEYVLMTDRHRVSVVIQSNTPLYNKMKRVAHPSTAITNNKMLYLMQEDWKAIRGEKDEKALLMIQDLLMRTFVMCSETASFRIEFDDGYWNALFVDNRHFCSAEITVERL